MKYKKSMKIELRRAVGRVKSRTLHLALRLVRSQKIRKPDLNSARIEK
jgi:hypothetical protein